MEYSRIGDTCVVRMDKGENIMETLKALCAKEDIRLAQVDALGAVDHAEIGVFDPEKRTYCREELNEFLEAHSHCCDDVDPDLLDWKDWRQARPFELVYENDDDWREKKSLQQLTEERNNN